jgi:calcium-dependent protein kinase
MNRYQVIREIGQGGNSTVHLVRSVTTNHQYACKVISKHLDPAHFSEKKISSHSKSVEKEIRIMKTLENEQNIIGLQDVTEDDQNYYIIMENCQGGDISTYMDKYRNEIDEHTIRDIIKNCLKTIATCHTYGIIHNDIKPQNFLLEREDDISTIKLIDFGISTMIQDVDNNACFESTPWYSSPESLQSKQCKKSDVWQCGVMTHLLLTGSFPFNDRQNPFKPSIYKIWRSVLNDNVNFDKEYWKDKSVLAKDFVSKLLDKEVSSRPTVHEALTHPWMTKENIPVTKNIGHMVVENMRKYSKKNIIMRTVLEDLIEILIQRYKKRLESYEYMQNDKSLYNTDYGIISLNSSRLSYLLHILRETTSLQSSKITKDDFKSVIKRMNSHQHIEDFVDICSDYYCDTLEMKTIVSSQMDWNAIFHEEHFEDFLTEIFDELDKNKNGTISKHDVNNSCKVLFHNKSVLSFEEFMLNMNAFVGSTTDNDDKRVHGAHPI